MIPSDLPQRATTLRATVQVCRVEPPEGKALKHFYVDLSNVRKDKAIQGVNLRLEDQIEGGTPDAILFTGHRGCGKSTELKQIQAQWAKNYHVIYIEATRETDIQDLRYTDLYLLVVRHIELALRDLDLKLNSSLRQQFEDWFSQVTKETDVTLEKSINVQGEVSLGAEAPFLAKLIFKLLAVIKGSETQKRKIRQVLEQDISKLQSYTNLLLTDAHQKLKEKCPDSKGFLIIFDNLDRCSPDVGHHLFCDYAAQLQALGCTVIYTAPISVVYSQANLNHTFGNPNIMPMINIYQYDTDHSHLSYDDRGVQAVMSIIEKRVEITKIFESQTQLSNLAKASGGHVRQLMNLIQNACLSARVDGHGKITSEDVNYAIQQEQFIFERIIPAIHYPILVDVYLTKTLPKDPQQTDIDQLGNKMLANLSVLEYNGQQRWNYPNPVVIRNQFFQRALQERKRS